MKLESMMLPDLRSTAPRVRAQVHDADETTLLCMRDGVVELGIVVFDFTSGDAGEVELVEIYVLPTLRSRGVGAEALRLAESFAQKAGRTFMTLYAEPLDDDTDDAKEALIKWYTRLGYRELGPCDRLGKSLTDTS